MDPRRKDDEPVEDMMWSSRRVRVPQRPVTPPVRAASSPQLPLKPQAQKQTTAPKVETKKSSTSTPLIKTAKSLPALRKKLPRIPKKVAAALCLLLVVGYVGTHLPKKDDAKSVKGTQTTGGSAKLSRNETPKFTTILPAGKTISDFGGWTRVSPPDSDPVFAYVDKIGNAPINVSQQPLPEEFKEDTAHSISQLSHDFRAEEKLTVGDTTAYIGTSAKGPQSVIFAKNDLLILIKSAVKIDNDQWTVYINSLQ